MVISNLDIGDTGVVPHEAEPPLIVDPDGVLTGAIAFQHMELIPWRRPKIQKRVRRREEQELAPRGAEDVRGKADGHPASEQLSSRLVLERLNHRGETYPPIVLDTRSISAIFWFSEVWSIAGLFRPKAQSTVLQASP